jgi:hypothetical protein
MQNAEHQRVTNGNQGVATAQHDSIYDLLEQQHSPPASPVRETVIYIIMMIE